MILLVSALFIYLLPILLLANISAVYLTLPSDPIHQMHIHWIETKKPSTLFYQSVSSSTWQEAFPQSEPLGPSDVQVHHILLQDLQPDAYYRFYLSSDPDAMYTFQTLPQAFTKPLRFAIGGDCYQHSTSRYQKMNRMLSKQELDFAIFGGDLAYVYRSWTWNRNPLARWISFLQGWQQAFSPKKMVPFLVIVGNHDVSKHSTTLFADLFPLPQGKSYQAIDFYDKLSLFLLDSGHICPVEGAQTKWLSQALEERKNIPYKLSMYHVAAYPSVCSFSNQTSLQIRSSWCPLFEQYGLQAAFEHHNHAFKRTFPLTQGQIDPKGVTYLGDGAWGIYPRKPKKNLPYVEKTAGTNCVSLVTFSQQGLKVETLDAYGNRIDFWEK